MAERECSLQSKEKAIQLMEKELFAMRAAMDLVSSSGDGTSLCHSGSCDWQPSTHNAR